MSPGHPKKYPRGTSVKAWGCPRHPLFISKKHQVIFLYAIFLLLHVICVFLGASLFLLCVLFCFVCCSIKLDPSYFVLERDTLLKSYIEHSSFHFYYFQCSSFHLLRLALCFSLIFCSELVSLLMNSSLIFMFIIYESCFNIWLAVEKERKSCMCIVMQMKACLDCGIDFCMSCRYCSYHELVDYAYIMTCFKQLRVSSVPLKVSCIVFSIVSIKLWYIFSCKYFNWVDLAHACTML